MRGPDGDDMIACGNMSVIYLGISHLSQQVVNLKLLPIGLPKNIY